ncbi:MAG: T9SS type A sorting domain-containing protein, partial [Bacteroidota bacterium]|nr:T9SS type A sorting domain-containing protein [Bacteroidota bacterium]
AHWNVIGSFKAAGNNSTVRAYSAQDPSPAIGNNFYRLLMVDADGASRFSAIKRIRFDAQGKISVYPNPATQLVTVSLGRAPVNDWQLIVTNSQGQVLLHNKYSGSSTTIALDVQHFQNGTYYLQLSDGANVQTSKLLVVHP